MDQQTWTTLAGFAGFGLAMLTFLTAMKRDLKADISGVRTELKADMAGLKSELKSEIASTRTELKTDIADTRAELKTDIARVETRLISLENRTYDISTRLPATPSAS